MSKTLLNADQIQIKAVEAGLSSGRRYGIAQHKTAIKAACDMLQAGDCDSATFSEAIAAMSNISALQQKLENAKRIDRQSRETVKANIFAALKA